MRDTGVIDSQTMSMMSLSRCGVSDTDAVSLHSRHKRYVVRGTSSYIGYLISVMGKCKSRFDLNHD